MVAAPVVPALDPVRMIEPPLPISGSAFWTVRIVPFTLTSKVSSMCLARGHWAQLSHGGVERFLPAAEDEDEGALLDEALCRGESDTGSAAGDHGGLSIQSGHDVHPSLELYGSGGAAYSRTAGRAASRTMRPMYGSDPHGPSELVRESIEIVRAAWRPELGHSTLLLDGRPERGSRPGSSAADPLGFDGRAHAVGRGVVGREELRPLPLHGARQRVAQCRRDGRAGHRALRRRSRGPAARPRARAA